MSTQTIAKTNVRTEIHQIVDQLPFEILHDVLSLLKGLFNIFNREATNGNEPNPSSFMPDSNPDETLQNEHPWMKFSGMFADDPYWDEYMECMAEVRAELNKVEEYDDELVLA